MFTSIFWGLTAFVLVSAVIFTGPTLILCFLSKLAWAQVEKWGQQAGMMVFWIAIISGILAGSWTFLFH